MRIFARIFAPPFVIFGLLGAAFVVMPGVAPALAQVENGESLEGGPAESYSAREVFQSTATMLDALASSPNEDAAKVLEKQIIGAWAQSGSDTVDLLMSWVSNAVKEKNFALAIELLNEIVELKPDYAEGWNRRATIYYVIDEYALSMADIQRVLALEPRHFGALAGMGAILYETGNNKHALDAFRRALEVHPFLGDARKAVEQLSKDVEGRGI